MNDVCKEYGCNSEKAPGRSRCWSHYTAHRAGKLIPEAPPEGWKLLALDIETVPNLAYVWDIWNQNVGINQIVEASEMLCFAASWVGQEDVQFYSEWEHGKQGMVLQAWKLLDEADCVLHYYGSRFDIPHMFTSFVLQGFPPPSPFKQIDLKTVVSKRFKFTSNKLQFVSQQLGLEGKIENEGFPLWTKCMAREPEALQHMEDYNRQDVILLEELYQILLPWIPNHPSRYLYEKGAGAGCPTCGADSACMVESGYAYTKMSRFLQHRCTQCSSYFRSCKRDTGVALQESTL